MNKKILIILFILAAAVFFMAVFRFQKSKKNGANLASSPKNNIQNTQNATPSGGNTSQSAGINNPPANQNIPKNALAPPLDRAGERVTKKPFGIFITPQNSPVQPEKFRGYHTGTDLEIFPEESNADVPVRAICDGKIAVKKTATGYGGVLVESCTLDNQPVMVVYGHLKLASISKNAGDALAQGETIGILGKAFSAETDGERKHLHLGIHKGASANILGYVQSQAELSGWVDACSLETVCK